MTSIPAFAAGSYRTDQTARTLVGLKGRLDGLTTQLATGRTAQTYGGLGTGRATSLAAHATIAALDGTIDAIAGSTARVGLAAQSLTQVKSLGDLVGSTLLSNRQATSPGIDDVRALGRSSLEGAVDALNQEVGGQFLFGGRAGGTGPVVAAALMLDGDPASGLSGLKTLIAEQTRADLGSGQGRLTQTTSGTRVSLSEDPDARTRANFGYSLKTATSSGAGVSASLAPASAGAVDLAFAATPRDGDRVRVAVLQPDGSQRILDLTARTSVPAGTTDAFAIGGSAGEAAANLKALLGGAAVASVQSASPPGLSAAFSGGTAGSLTLDVGTPKAGDSLTLTLGLRDGTTQTITLTASSEAGTNRFAIGASPAETAANLSRALSDALSTAAGTGLAAASAARAARDFFDGSSSPGLAPRRVAADGNGYAETASAGTVVWYRGDDAPGDPRADAQVQTGASRTVAVGARANEPALRAALAGFALLATAGARDGTGANDPARFAAVAERAQTLMKGDGGSVADIAGTFALAAGTMEDARAQARTAKTTLQDSLDGIETVSTEEVAAKLLAVQNQLQASYQVTSMLSKLSLVNYLS